MLGLCLWITSAVMSVSGLSVQFMSATNIVRDLSGDLFSVRTSDCRSDECAGNGKSAQIISSAVRQCRCQCSDSHPVFREDHNKCINQLDCPLVAFIRPHLTEHIPVVSLPVSAGQLIHPGAHLIIGVDSSISHSKQLMCQIESSNVMTPEGWQPFRQKDGSQAFELYEDGNHTFLQWLATDSLRQKLYQKLVLIGLICTAADSSVEINIFRPCIAMRIGWVPGLGIKARDGSELNSRTDSGHNGNYLMIGLCLGILGLIYVSALMVYMRNKHTTEPKNRLNPKNRHITANRLHSDSEDSRTIADVMSINTSNHSIDNLRNSSHYSSPESLSLNHRSSSDSPEWSPDLPSIDYNSSNNSDEESQSQKAENSHDSEEAKESELNANRNPIYDKILQKPERIPRFSLRISPELFEPKLLQNPPPTALEMLNKIRDLISIAKSRLRNFKFRPTLVVIPEDDYFYNDSSKNGINSTNEGDKESSDISSTDETTDQMTRSGGDSRPETSSSADVVSDDNHKVFNSEQTITLSVTQSPKSSDKSESDIRSVSRKKIVNDMKMQFFNDLNYDNKVSDSVDKSISGKNVSLESDRSDKTYLSQDIHSDLKRHLSSKIEQNFYRTFENQIIDRKQSTDSSDNRMISYFKNSLGRLSGKSKPKSEQVLISSNNWTLQTVNADRRHRHRNMTSKSVIRKRMATRRGQLCYNCSDVSSLSNHPKNDTFADLDPKTSLESNENNEAIDSLDFYTNSDSEMSTTSSTVRDNPFTSLESEINDDSNGYHRTCESDANADETSPIDECLKYLAAASVDTANKNHDKYYQRIGRASKGMSAIRKLRSSEWNHVCHRSDSELEACEAKTDSKTNVYSKNSKSRITSSKSLNSHNRKKFQKQLALYKSHSNEVLNRSDAIGDTQDISHTTNFFCDQNGSILAIEQTEEVANHIGDHPEDGSNAHFVVKIKI